MYIYINILYVVPTTPRNLKIMDFTNTGVTFSVTLTWGRPDPPNGLIIQYNVSDIIYKEILQN